MNALTAAQFRRKGFGQLTWLALLGLVGGFTFGYLRAATDAPNIMIWDTGTRLRQPGDAQNRASWSLVPAELFGSEADPLKAASDPGYYGREYAFKGDAAVENSRLIMVFRSTTGRVSVHPKVPPTLPSSTSSPASELSPPAYEFSPNYRGQTPLEIGPVNILRNAGDEVRLEATFSAKGRAAEMSAVFTLGRDEIVEIKPSASMEDVQLTASLEYGIIPGFIGDDLILRPSDFSKTESLALPTENVFLGLSGGGGSELVMTWPPGSQKLAVRLGADSRGRRQFEALVFESKGQSFYLAVLNAPGIWHRETLKPTFLEKAVPLAWKRPFSAKWKTQLSEAGVPTAFNFRSAKGEIWRGVPGAYVYPAWFDGDTAMLQLSKKVPPKGDALIYFLEGQETPPTLLTPVEVMKSTLGRSVCEPLMDVAGRKLRSHHRRGGEGVHRACTCGCTEFIQAIFEAGQETTKRSQVHEALEDMNYFVDRHVERIEEYQRFAQSLLDYLKGLTQPNTPAELKLYIENLTQITRQLPGEYQTQKDNLKSPAYATELTRRTWALTNQQDAKNLPAYLELLKAWRAMGGAQDYVLAQSHLITRKLAQAAGYDSLTLRSSNPVAREIRARCRQVLRNPDGYEIWAEY